MRACLNTHTTKCQAQAIKSDASSCHLCCTTTVCECFYLARPHQLAMHAHTQNMALLKSMVDQDVSFLHSTPGAATGPPCVCVLVCSTSTLRYLASALPVPAKLLWALVHKQHPRQHPPPYHHPPTVPAGVQPSQQRLRQGHRAHGRCVLAMCFACHGRRMLAMSFACHVGRGAHAPIHPLTLRIVVPRVVVFINVADGCGELVWVGGQVRSVRGSWEQHSTVQAGRDSNSQTVASNARPASGGLPRAALGFCTRRLDEPVAGGCKKREPVPEGRMRGPREAGRHEGAQGGSCTWPVGI